ncbi:MAG TPA: glycosyl hydrolase family 28 protein, partial [Verrucomicrobiae bacterium]|nr:glycosyl hydrolase family 28 protein [Verrucomicrobiae bacterium]
MTKAKPDYDLSKSLLFVMTTLGTLALAANVSATPTLPSINTNNVVTITDSPYNAVGDGATDNTAAIQNAINAAAALSGGGTVRVPAPGLFLSGPLSLKSKVNLQIDGGAKLEMLPLSQFTAYPNSTSYFIYANNVTDVEISGDGTIDGQGADWWSPLASSRPYMVYFNRVNRVLVQDITLQNPPKMHLVFKSTDGNITIRNIRINTTAANAKNTDGIDLIGTNCLVQNCVINAGDDNIALGSSAGVTADVLITNCTFGVGHGV